MSQVSQPAGAPLGTRRAGWATRPERWGGFALGALVVAVVVALDAAVAPAPLRVFDHTSNVAADSTLTTYLSEVSEHAELIRQALALEFVTPAAVARPDAAVVQPEGYVAEHERLIGATLGDEFNPAPAASVAPGLTTRHARDHERQVLEQAGLVEPEQ